MNILDSLLGDLSDSSKSNVIQNTNKIAKLSVQIVLEIGEQSIAEVKYSVDYIREHYNSLAKQTTLNLLQQIKAYDADLYLFVRESIEFNIRKCAALLIQEITLTVDKYYKSSTAEKKIEKLASLLEKQMQSVLSKRCSNSQWRLPNNYNNLWLKLRARILVNNTNNPD